MMSNVKGGLRASNSRSSGISQLCKRLWFNFTAKQRLFSGKRMSVALSAMLSTPKVEIQNISGRPSSILYTKLPMLAEHLWKIAEYSPLGVKELSKCLQSTWEGIRSTGTQSPMYDNVIGEDEG